jgi:tetratricopeptide (TPR) repeat protein
MPSLIPGYEYDIFISYRQKDNKYDGWVTEFVENLKKELEATFKEEIHVYFDINPHDGLLETHEVDESLKEKLKCLVFIPIISRTYCDPKSFAWDHEFKAFVDQASKDQFGLKIKLPNGNVASRVLPIRIYDLDNEDIKLCESVLGGMMRGVEFIYEEPGVNRPLKSDDDEKINLKRTKYRNQINKVGNSIKEIIQGLKSGSVDISDEKAGKEIPLKQEIKDEKIIHESKSSKYPIPKLISTTAIIIILVVAAIILYPKIFERDRLAFLRSKGTISVAVMPFQNMTSDTTKNIWQDLIQYNLSNILSTSEDLEIRQVEFIDNLIKTRNIINYASLTPAVTGSIAKKLDADVFVTGNIGQIGNNIRFNAQLIDTKTKMVLKPFQIDGSSAEEIDFDVIDSLSGMIKEFLAVSKLQRETSPANLKYASVTNSPEAYRYYILGQKAFAIRDYPTARDYFSQALSLDSNFFYAHTLTAMSYGNTGQYKQNKEIVLKLYKRRESLPLDQRLYLNSMYANCFETPLEAIKYMKQLSELDDTYPGYHYLLGTWYNSYLQYNNAIPEYEKALVIYDKWGSKPWWQANYTGLGYCYHMTGQYKKEAKLYKEAEKDFPDDPELLYRQAVWALSTGKNKAANKYIDRYISISRNNSVPDIEITTQLAIIYWEAGLNDQAEEYFREALKSESESPMRINNLAWFLIDTDRNINKGLELVSKTLESEPDNYSYLETKGWGLYKQGKYKESSEFLQLSWDLRLENAVYNQAAFLRLEEAKNAVANQN